MPENENQIVVLILAFTACLLILALSFFLLIVKYRRILEKRQAEALNNLIAGQDNERERLSRDLHDRMGPQLNAVRALVSGVKTEDPEQNEVLAEIKEELRKAQKDVRDISHDLMSASLRKYGLTEAIKKLSERSGGERLQIDVEANTGGAELSDRQISHLYSIARELILNSVKHSGADQIRISLHSDREKRQFDLAYSDNGRGLKEADSLQEGIGMQNMRTRVRLMDGELEFPKGAGFQVKLHIRY